MTKIGVVLLSIATSMVVSAGAIEPQLTRPHVNPVVVLVGVPGLQWSDLSPTEAPALWRLGENGSIGSLSVRTLGAATCPADGWLTVSAGSRAAGHGCGLVSPPVRHDAGAQVPDFTSLKEGNGHSDFGAGIGSLGDAVHRAGGCTTAVGPGAALGLADSNGRVDHYVPAPQDLVPADWRHCPIAAVDVDAIIRPYAAMGPLDQLRRTLPADRRREAVHQTDQLVATVLAGLPEASKVVVAGLSDHDSRGQLRVAIVDDGSGRGSYLGSRSTQQPDLVTLPDLTGTLLALLGTGDPTIASNAARSSGTREVPVAKAVGRLVSSDVAATTTESVRAPFIAGLVVMQLLLYGLVALQVWRRRFSGVGRRRMSVAIRVWALACAAVPVASVLTNLVPWPHAPTPRLAVAVVTLGLTGLIVAISLVGRWRQSPVIPSTMVAAATALTLAGDLITRSSLQLNNPYGYTAIEGARYYGMGNIPFALFATALLLLGATLAVWIMQRGASRLLGAGVVIGLGLVGAALDAAPMWGSDLGGVIAIVPGTAVTALMLLGVRISLARLAALCAAGVTAVIAVAYLDHLRPTDRQSHLGRFFGQIVNGQAPLVIDRKLGAMVHAMVTVQTIPVLIVAVTVWLFAIKRPTRPAQRAVHSVLDRTPALRSGLAGVLTTGVVGMLANDSGVAVLAFALLLAIPLTIAATVHVPALPATQGDMAGDATGPAERFSGPPKAGTLGA